eukprot:5860087-Prymnesium_polylepis.1
MRQTARGASTLSCSQPTHPCSAPPTRARQVGVGTGGRHGLAPQEVARTRLFRPLHCAGARAARQGGQGEQGRARATAARGAP